MHLYLTRTLLISLSYYIFGSLSLLLAIPPGFATPVWPAAGIALAAILLWGYKYLPAIFLGSFCTNLFIASNSGANILDLLPVLIASGIAAGATLQGGISAYIINRVVKIPNRLEQEFDIFNILLRGGLLGCLINSGIGTSVLLSAGFITGDAFMFGWLTWWVGDAIGVILITPLVITLATKGISTTRKYSVVIPMITIFALAVTIFYSARESEEQAAINKFTSLTHQEADLINNQVHFFKRNLQSIKHFYSASNFVSRSEFSTFTSDLLKNQKSINSLLWAPLVKTGETEIYTHQAKKDGLINYMIWEQLNGSKTQTTNKNKYFPIYYIVSKTSNIDVAGFDLSSNTNYLKAINLSRDSGKQTIEQSTGLFNKNSFLLMQPVYKRGLSLKTIKERRTAFKGVTLINFNLEKFLDRLSVSSASNQYQLQVRERTPSGKEALIYNTRSRPAKFSHEVPFDIGEKTWTLIFTPTNAFFSELNNQLTWFVLIGGLLFTGLLQIFLLSITARTDVIRRLVETKTNALIHSEEQFRSAMQYSAVGMSLVSTGSHWIKVNRALCELVGYTHKELLQMDFTALIHPDDMQVHSSLLQQLSNGEIETYQIENRIIHKKGHDVWVASSVSAVWDKAKKPKYFICQTRNISERRKAEQKLETTSKTLSLILDNAAEGVYGVDLDGNTTFANQAALNLVGYTMEEMLNVSQHKLIHHHYADGTPYPREQCNIYASFKDGTTRTEDREVFWHKSGKAIPVEYTSSPIRNEDGEIEGAVVVFRDISERQKVEKAITEAHQFQDLIMNNVPGMVFVKDDEFKIVQANDEFLDLYPPEQRDRILGYTTLESYDAKEAEVFLKNDITAFEEGYSEAEETITFPDGSMKTLLTKKVKFTNSDNRNYILGLSYDITELQKKDRELLESEEKHRSVVENIADGLITVTSRGIIESFNPAAGKIFGYNAEEVIGRNINILMPSDERARHDQYIKHYSDSDRKSFIGMGRELVGQHKDGTEFPMEISVSEIELNGQQFFSAIVRDITERKKAEEELLRSNMELERFAYIASHDLQEPLRMVSSFTDLIQEEYQDSFDDKANKYMGFIANASQRMQDLVKDLLDYSRAGQSVPNLEPVECNKLVSSVLEALAEVIEETGAEVTFDEMPEIYSNPIRVSRLLQNLIGNAIKYKKQGTIPKIHVGIKSDLNYWTFSISDNGIGIKEEYLEQVFVLFKRLHNKDEYTGTGIGLAICKKIVESIGGKIWVESEFGAGSTFYFNIPRSNLGKEAA